MRPAPAAGGACFYSYLTHDCDFGCANGSCKQDPCIGVTCNNPPANSCAGPNTLKAYMPNGTCSSGACSYTSTSVDCPFGCSNGTCNQDPCAGLTCNSPPAPSCADAHTLKTYSPSGTCSAGACSYSFTTQNCAFGCSNGSCSQDPCAGLTCNSPPATSCSDSWTLRGVWQHRHVLRRDLLV